MTIRTVDEELVGRLRAYVAALVTEPESPTDLRVGKAMSANIMDEAATLIEQLHNRVERLRGAMIRSGRAAGCVLADSVSDEFLMLVPAEIEAKIEQLVEREARARSGEHQLPRDSDR